MRFDYLLKGIQIGTLKIQNRISMPAINHAYSEDGSINGRLLEYYKQRARGGVGMIVIGGCAVHSSGRSLRCVRIDDDSYIAGMQALTATIHEYPVKVIAQLYHAGGYAKSKEIGQQSFAPTALLNSYTREIPKEMSTEDIHTIEDSYVSAALRAMKAGFDGIELIASAGYLVAEFLSPLTNQRTDDFGGTPDRRRTFLLNVIKRIKQATRYTFPIIVRISGNDFVKGGGGLTESVQLAKVLAQNGIDAIDVTGGWHESNIPQVTGEVPAGGFGYLAQSIKQEVNIPVICSNRINTPEQAERMIAMGMCDMVNMARPLIADPELPQKVRGGETELIRKCIACGQGCYDRRFSGKAVGCIINYDAGQESESSLEPTGVKKRILVVGGGISGMEFAIQAALRNHIVEVWEKNISMGGQLRYIPQMPGKNDYRFLIEYQVNMLKKLGVSIRCNEIATKEKILSFSPDVLIWAAGGKPRPLTVTFENGSIPVANTEEVLTDQVVPGQRIVIIGGGAVGCEIATLLAEQGTLTAEQTRFLMFHRAEPDEMIHKMLERSSRKVTIIEMGDDIGKGIGISTRWGIRKRMKQMGIEIKTNTKALSLTDQSVIVELADGTIEELFADSVVVATGLLPNEEIIAEIEGEIPEIYVIGDAKKPDSIEACIREAVELGRKI